MLAQFFETWCIIITYYTVSGKKLDRFVISYNIVKCQQIFIFFSLLKTAHEISNKAQIILSTTPSLHCFTTLC